MKCGSLRAYSLYKKNIFCSCSRLLFLHLIILTKLVQLFLYKNKKKTQKRLTYPFNTIVFYVYI